MNLVKTVTTTAGEIASVEAINLSVGQETPIATLRYTVGVSTTEIDIIRYNTATPQVVPTGVFEVDK